MRLGGVRPLAAMSGRNFTVLEIILPPSGHQPVRIESARIVLMLTWEYRVSRYNDASGSIQLSGGDHGMVLSAAKRRRLAIHCQRQHGHPYAPSSSAQAHHFVRMPWALGQSEKLKDLIECALQSFKPILDLPHSTRVRRVEANNRYTTFSRRLCCSGSDGSLLGRLSTLAGRSALYFRSPAADGPVFRQLPT